MLKIPNPHGVLGFGVLGSKGVIRAEEDKGAAIYLMLDG